MLCAGVLVGALLAVGLLGALCAFATPDAAFDAPPTATEFELTFWVETAPSPPPVVTWLFWVFEMVACDCPALACASPVVALETTSGDTTSAGGWAWPPPGLPPEGGGVGNGWLPPAAGLAAAAGEALAAAAGEALAAAAGETLAAAAGEGLTFAAGEALAAAAGETLAPAAGEGLAFAAGEALAAAADEGLAFAAGEALAAAAGEALAAAAGDELAFGTGDGLSAAAGDGLAFGAAADDGLAFGAAADDGLAFGAAAGDGLAFGAGDGLAAVAAEGFAAAADDGLAFGAVAAGEVLAFGAALEVVAAGLALLPAPVFAVEAVALDPEPPCLTSVVEDEVEAVADFAGGADSASAAGRPIDPSVIAEASTSASVARAQ
jgi:hypothetical protein